MQVIVTPRACKQYKHIPPSEQTKIEKRLNALENDPYIGKELLGELSGLRTLRAWPYRIIYVIDKERKIVFVVSIIHRQGAYKT